MNATRVAGTAAVICVSCAFFGCPPASEQNDIQYRYPAAAGLVPGGINELVRANAPLTSKQASVLLPPPEQIMKVSKLAKFLEGQPGWNGESIADEIEGLYRGFIWSKDQRNAEHAEHSSWQDDKAFLACTIWLYDWSKPHELILGGLPPRKTGIVSSAYILIEGEMVVDAGTLIRSKNNLDSSNK
jgi:hypothetical protein